MLWEVPNSTNIQRQSHGILQSLYVPSVLLSVQPTNLTPCFATELYPPLPDLRILSSWWLAIIQIRSEQHHHTTSRPYFLPQQSQSRPRILIATRRERRCEDLNERCEDRSNKHRWKAPCWTKRNAQRNRSILEREDRRNVEL